MRHFRLTQTCFPLPLMHPPVQPELFQRVMAKHISGLPDCTGLANWSFQLNYPVNSNSQFSQLSRSPATFNPIQVTQTVAWDITHTYPPSHMMFPLNHLLHPQSFQGCEAPHTENLCFKCMWHLSHPVQMLLQASPNRWWSGSSSITSIFQTKFTVPSSVSWVLAASFFFFISSLVSNHPENPRHAV